MRYESRLKTSPTGRQPYQRKQQQDDGAGRLPTTQPDQREKPYGCQVGSR
jgi:hypothetical protein